MNHTPRYGAAAVTTPRFTNNLSSVNTPCTPGYVPSPASPARPYSSNSSRRASVSESFEPFSPQHAQGRANGPLLEVGAELPLGASVSRQQAPVGIAPNLPVQNQTSTWTHETTSPGSSSGDNYKWSGVKKQKLGAVPQNETPTSAFAWRPRNMVQAGPLRMDFSTPKIPGQCRSSEFTRTTGSTSNAQMQLQSSSPGSSDVRPQSTQLNKAFQIRSTESSAFSEIRPDYETAVRNRSSSNDTTPKETTPSSNFSQPPKFKGTRAPLTESSSSSLNSDHSMTTNDVQHTRPKSRNRHILSDVDSSNQAFLSVVWQAGKLAVAYYDVDLCQIFMMPDVQENDQFTLYKKVIDQIQPRCVVVGSKQDDRLVKVINVPDDGSENGLSLEKDEYIQVLPSIDFSADLCKRRILAVDLPNIPEHFTESDRTLYLSSLIPFENINMVRAVGGLLKFLDKKRIGIELEDQSCRVPVLALNVFTLKDMMLIDDNTFGALQIFHRESHPSVYKAGFSNAAKEGLSLYGILNRCRSQIGSKMLRLWFQRPTRDLELLKQRQDAIAFFSSARNFEVTSTLMECQKNIKNISRILGRMTQSQASLSEWQALYKTVYNAIHIGDICRAQGAGVAVLNKIGAKFTDDLHRIGSLISKIVDFEESTAQGRFVVKVGVDPELDQKKRTYNGLPDFLTKVARDELDKLANDITECNIRYLPQLGYLLAVPETEELKSRDNYKIDTLEFMFMSNKMLHYKSESTKELDLILGDTHSEIADHETGIMHRLQNTILEHSAVLLDVMQYSAELDCLLAMAAAAKEGNYVRPELSAEKGLKIKAGRHPLQELCVSSYVPNDTFGDSRNGLVKILTGPNASGKSVYLKQVAVIVYMAHIGSFVPADEAQIGLTDAIYTRVRTQESVSVGLSTFMIDLNQVSNATRSATSNSLVLLDEFGKGTETEDGLSLLCACLKFWLNKKDQCPHILVSTHFHSLVSRKLLQESTLLKYQTMEVLRDDDGELVFLYQLVNGSTQTSYACHVATIAGIPKEIVSRGNEVSELIRTNRPIGRVDSENNQNQLERGKSIVKKFLELDLEKDNLQTFLHNTVLPSCQLLK